MAAVFLFGATGGVVRAATTEHQSQELLRVMPLGDSITEGNGWQVPGAYRPALWDLAMSSGDPILFVGSQKSGPVELPDKEHEGYPGKQIQEIDALVGPELTTYRPDVILLHIGTNNIWRQGELPTVAPERLAGLIDHILTAAPQAELYVASIVPSALQDANVRAFNATIPAMVADRAARGAKIAYVDMYSHLNSGDLIDGIHPSSYGYRIMAQEWWSAMQRDEQLWSGKI